MGNRAVITTEEKEIGVYLHWNGGRDSVEAFLKFCELKEYRPPEEDCYGWACLCGVISNYFQDGCGVGIGKYENLDTDNGDNGVYVIKDWKIIGREYYSGEEQKGRELSEMLGEINKRMPEEMRLGDEEMGTQKKNTGPVVYYDDNLNDYIFLIEKDVETPMAIIVSVFGDGSLSYVKVPILAEYLARLEVCQEEIPENVIKLINELYPEEGVKK